MVCDRPRVHVVWNQLPQCSSVFSSGVSPTSPLYFGAAEATRIKPAGHQQAGQCDVKHERESADVVVVVWCYLGVGLSGAFVPAPPCVCAGNVLRFS